MPAGWRSDREQRCCEKLNEIGYVDFHWMTKAECTTEQIALLDSPELENETYLKLIGTAGSGKTTALRQIYYILLRNYNQTSHKRIPIFYELKDLPDTDSPLSYIITKCYSVSQELADNLLETEELILLLDGYDELRDRNRKQKLALKLEEYLKDHKTVRVIITDRSVRNVIPILEDQGKVLRLRPFTEQDKRNYFEKNCTNTELKSLILEALSQKTAVFEELSTPLRLHAFIKFTERDGAIPDDFIRCFLDSLIERERKEKKDPNLDVLEIYLCAATVKTGQENNWVEESVLLSVMKKAADQLGRQGYDTQTALRLATEMGIMQIKEETEGRRKPKKYYRFDTEEFMDYYSDILAEDAVLNAFFEQEGTT